MMSSRRSLPVKRALRFVYTSLLFCLAWIINPKVRLKGLIAVRRDLKASDDLLLVAPGSSVRGLTRDDWDGFRNHDRLFVNYAALHESFRPGDLLSTEPHETIAEFVDGVAELDGPVLLKGFTSLSNVHVCLKTIRHLRRVRNRVIMIREIDASDLWNFPVVDDYYGDYFANDGLSNIAVLDGASLVYFLNAGLRMGYRSITLVGFDFDSHYFFDGEDAVQDGGDDAQAAPHKHILNWDDFLIRKVNRIIKQADLKGCDIQSYKSRVNIRHLDRSRL